MDYPRLTKLKEAQRHDLLCTLCHVGGEAIEIFFPVIWRLPMSYR